MYVWTHENCWRVSIQKGIREGGKERYKFCTRTTIHRSPVGFKPQGICVEHFLSTPHSSSLFNSQPFILLFPSFTLLSVRDFFTVTFLEGKKQFTLDSSSYHQNRGANDFLGQSKSFLHLSLCLNFLHSHSSWLNERREEKCFPLFHIRTFRIIIFLNEWTRGSLLSPFSYSSSLLLSFFLSVKKLLNYFSYLNSPRFLYFFHFLFSSSSIERNGMWFHAFQSYYYFFLFQEVFSREWDWSGMKAHLSFSLATSSLKKLLHLRTWSFFFLPHSWFQWLSHFHFPLLYKNLPFPFISHIRKSLIVWLEVVSLKGEGDESVYSFTHFFPLSESSYRAFNKKLVGRKEEIALHLTHSNVSSSFHSFLFFFHSFSSNITTKIERLLTPSRSLFTHTNTNTHTNKWMEWGDRRSGWRKKEAWMVMMMWERREERLRLRERGEKRERKKERQLRCWFLLGNILSLFLTHTFVVHFYFFSFFISSPFPCLCMTPSFVTISAFLPHPTLLTCMSPSLLLNTPPHFFEFSPIIRSCMFSLTPNHSFSFKNSNLKWNSSNLKWNSSNLKWNSSNLKWNSSNDDLERFPITSSFYLSYDIHSHRSNW